MRGPFSAHDEVDREMTGNSRIRLLQELSELGWFNGGSGPVLSMLTGPELHAADEDP